MAVTRTARSWLVALALVVPSLRSAEADTEMRAVEVIATGEKSSTREVEVLVRELLQRFPVTIRWISAPEIDPGDVLSRRVADPGLAARVWVDLSVPKGARLFVANAASDHFLVRLVPAEEGHREVEEEAVAQIIGSAVDAILAGGEIGVTREVAARQISIEPRRDDAVLSKRAPEPPVPSPLSRAGWSGGLGAFVGLRALGAGPAVGVEPGLLALVVAPRRWHMQPLLILEMNYEAPLDWQAQAVDVRLEGAGGSLQPGLQIGLGARVSLRASAGLGFEAMYVEPHVAPGSAFAARGPFWLAATVATARLGFDVAIATHVSVFAAAGFEVDLSGIQFNVSDNGSAEPNVIPWRVWPVAYLGVHFHLEGAPGPSQ